MKAQPVIQVVGFSLFLPVDILSFHAATAFAEVPGFEHALLGEYFSGLILARIATYATITAATVFAKRTFIPRVPCALAATACSLVGIGLIALSFTRATPGALFLCGIGLFGSAQGVMSLTWLATLTTYTYRGSYLYLIGCHALATALCALTLFLPEALLLPTTVCALILANASTITLPRTPREPNALAHHASDVAPLLWRDIVAVGVFAFVSGFVTSLSREGSPTLSAVNLQLATLLISSAVLVVMALPALLLRQPLKLESGYRIALPLSAIGFLVLPGLVDTIPPSLAGTFATTGYMLTGIVLYCTIDELAKTARVPALPLLSGSDCATHACLLAGLVIGTLVSPYIAQADTGVALTGMGCLYLVALGASWLIGRSGIAATHTGKLAHLQAANQQQGEKFGAASGSLDAGSLDEMLGGLTDQEQAVLPLLLEGHTLKRVAEELYMSQSAVKYHVQKIYRRFDVHTRSELADLFAARGSVMSRTSAQQLAAACSRVANQHNLTEREAEILTLLAQGASVSDVAQRFDISENTVKTHAKRLYTKVGVHSKQELIDLVSKM